MIQAQIKKQLFPSKTGSTIVTKKFQVFMSNYKTLKIVPYFISYQLNFISYLMDK